MKRNEANRRDEQKDEQKDGMNSELLWVIFISMPVCEMKKEWLLCSAEMTPYLAMHEFKVDSFQSDLQESTFTSFHVLDREFSTQFWTWRKHLQFNQLQQECTQLLTARTLGTGGYFHVQNRHHLPYTKEIPTD